MKYLITYAFILFYIPVFPQGNWAALPGAPSLFRIDDISFINDSTGFIAVYDSIYRTDNIGNTWYYVGDVDTSNLPGTNYSYVRSIEFINDTLGFIGGIVGASGYGGLFRTIDGGINWSKLQNMQMNNTDGICGIDSDSALLIAVGTVYGPPRFYKTNDYGNSWITSNLDSLASALVDCNIIDENTYLISGVSDTASGEKATILKTTDGGITWNRVYMSTSTLIGYVWKIFMRSNGKGIASIQMGQTSVCLTNDSGDTWTEHVVDSNFQNYGGVAMFNDSLGWVSDQYEPYLWTTIDGGMSWSISNVINAGNRMVVTPGNNVLASGYTIYRYDFPTGLGTPQASFENIHKLIIHPNPVSGILNINANAGCITYGLIDILNTEGRIVKRCYTGHFQKGENIFDINISDLSAGNYIVLWRNNERFTSEKVNVVKRK